MSKASATIAACATLLWGGTALAQPTAQQQCDYERLTASKRYSACIENVVAKDAKGSYFDEFAAFARCRHAYFRKWTGFQNPKRRPQLTGSTCIGARFTDNGDETVMDKLTTLVWEKKDNLDGTQNFTDPHDADNNYALNIGTPYTENGTAFKDFLAALNGGNGFAGANGWRMPTLGELQTLSLDFECTGAGTGPTCICPASTCVDPALGLTQPSGYWSVTAYLPDAGDAWGMLFDTADVYPFSAAAAAYARAVRGGL